MSSSGEPYLTNRSEGPTTAYHTRRDCRQVQSMRDPTERSAAYIEWHDLEQCEDCAALEAGEGYGDDPPPSPPDTLSTRLAAWLPDAVDGAHTAAALATRYNDAHDTDLSSRQVAGALVHVRDHPDRYGVAVETELGDDFDRRWRVTHRDGGMR